MIATRETKIRLSEKEVQEAVAKWLNDLPTDKGLPCYWEPHQITLMAWPKAPNAFGSVDHEVRIEAVLSVELPTA